VTGEKEGEDEGCVVGFMEGNEVDGNCDGILVGDCDGILVGDCDGIGKEGLALFLVEGYVDMI
jgi:hypothetical protein